MFLYNLAVHAVLCLFPFESAMLALSMYDDYMHLFRQYELYSKGYIEKWIKNYY